MNSNIIGVPLLPFLENNVIDFSAYKSKKDQVQLAKRDIEQVLELVVELTELLQVVGENAFDIKEQLEATSDYLPENYEEQYKTIHNVSTLLSNNASSLQRIASELGGWI